MKSRLNKNGFGDFGINENRGRVDVKKVRKNKKLPDIPGACDTVMALLWAIKASFFVYSRFMQVLLARQAVPRVEPLSSGAGSSSRLTLTNPKRAANASAVLVKM